jgi:hypothetical protein
MSRDNDEDDETPPDALAKPYGGFRARARRKLTDEVLSRIFRHRATGGTWEEACAREGVRTESLRRLAQRDPEVGEAYEEADGRGARFYRRKIAACLNSGDPTLTKAWSGWAWLGERFHPRVFRKPSDRVDMTLSQKDPNDMSESEAVAYLEEIGRGGVAKVLTPERARRLLADGVIDAVDAEVEGEDE